MEPDFSESKVRQEKETPRNAGQRQRGRIRISVRNLVEFIFRSGDIDNRVGKGVQAEAMQEGSRMHRKIQHGMGAGYRAEVSLCCELDLGEYDLVIEGRADGIVSDEEMTRIHEIKCMYTDVTRFEEPLTVHLAQAECYACLYAAQNGLDRMGVRITYCDLDTEKQKQFERVFSAEELDDWFAGLIASYRKWTDHQYEWQKIRTKSIAATQFPFAYREGQRELVADVYRTIAREKILFLQAPTGTGKTIATVFPAVQAVGQGLADRIFYLTAKTITRTVAAEAFSLLKVGGLQMKVITITAKEKLCPLEVMDCNPQSCPYAKGHYDRVGEAVYELMTGAHDYTRKVLLEQALRYRVCPFEMTLDLALWSDAVICDYNYVFDPNVCLRRFFPEGERGDSVFLIDEAHNLVERGREMYSAHLVKEEFLRMKRIFKRADPKIASALEACNRQMLEWKRSCEGYLVLDSVGNFAFSLMRLMSLLDAFLRRRGEIPERGEVTEFYFSVRHFLNMFDRMDEKDVLYVDFDGEGHFVLHLYCVNPAKPIEECLDRGKSAVFFSATLLPVSYYKALLCTRRDCYAVYAHTSFSAAQRLLFVAGDVSSLYTRRTASEYQKIAAYIALVARARRGNYIVYVPSYRYMEDVYAQFVAQFGEEIACILQSPVMSEAEREEFLEEFSRPRDRSLVAFCVIGGVFAEGIDLPHDRLIGVLIVGTGLAQICNEREVLRDYYRENGFCYAYQVPGMNKVMQAAGRVIRTATDVGVIGLLDERFLRRDYRELFPREWADFTTCRLETLPGILEDFWGETAGKSD